MILYKVYRVVCSNILGYDFLISLFLFDAVFQKKKWGSKVRHNGVIYKRNRKEKEKKTKEHIETNQVNCLEPPRTNSKIFHPSVSSSSICSGSLVKTMA